MSVIHRARSFYESLPDAARKPVASVVRALPTRVRYGKAFVEEMDAIARARADEAFARREATARLTWVLEAASSTARYSGLLSGNWRADPWTALCDLPLCDKDDIKGDLEAFRPGSDVGPVKWVTTAGSSGVPFGFWLEKNASVRDWAYVVDAWARIGFRLDDRRVVLRGRVLSEAGNLRQFEPIRRELYLSVFHLNADRFPDYVGWWRDFGPAFVHGYPSALTDFARLMQETGQRVPTRGVFPVSEQLRPNQRAYLAEAFGAPVLSFYGLSEKAAFAAQCLLSDDYHVEPLYGVIELADEKGRPIQEMGTLGEIVTTGFLNRATTMIRYKTGDMAAWNLERCPCGLGTPRLAGLSGRWRSHEYLIGRHGERLSMTAINMHSPVFDRVREFVFVQRHVGEAELLLVTDDRFGEGDMDQVRSEVGAKIGHAVDFSVRLVERLPRTAAGKRPFIVREIDGETT